MMLKLIKIHDGLYICASMIVKLEADKSAYGQDETVITLADGSKIVVPMVIKDAIVRLMRGKEE